jgi:cytochrome c oxidase subunit 2
MANRLNNSESFDSYMIPDSELIAKKHVRLLETDNPLKIPSDINIRGLITSNDVIHS